MTDSYALAVDIGGTFTDMVVRDSRGRTWVEQKRLRPGSGGDGRSKGGDGQVISFRVRTSKPWLLNAIPRRIDHALEGLDGGESGLTGRFLVNGKAVREATKIEMQPDDVVLMETPGGGGYGKVRARG